MKDELYAQRASMLPNDRACLSKRVFFSKGEAAQAASAHRRPGERKGRPYRCPNCQQFHIAVGKKNKVKQSRAQLRAPFSRARKSAAAMASLIVKRFYRRTPATKTPFADQERAIRLLLSWWGAPREIGATGAKQGRKR